jgi:hypothetical protein
MVPVGCLANYVEDKYSEVSVDIDIIEGIIMFDYTRGDRNDDHNEIGLSADQLPEVISVINSESLKYGSKFFVRFYISGNVGQVIIDFLSGLLCGIQNEVIDDFVACDLREVITLRCNDPSYFDKFHLKDVKFV